MPKSLKFTPLQSIKGVGPARSLLLKNLGIDTVEDLLYLFPYRYEDRRTFTPIKKLALGQYQTVCADVIVGGAKRSFSAKQMVEIIVGDDTGRITAVWFNQPYMASNFKPGMRVIFYGKVDVYKNRLQMVAPDYEIVDGDEKVSLHMGRIVPIYPLTKGIGQKYLRQIIHICLQEYADQVRDIIPEAIRKRQGFTPITESIRQIHFPQTLEEQTLSHERIVFEEFFLFQIAVLLRRMSIVKKIGIAHQITDKSLNQITGSIGFKLTAAQINALKTITEDMQKKNPMLRLLQGDVGSGKTIVAFCACLAAIANGHQAAIMAPTEILAKQHGESFKRLFAKGPFAHIKAEVLTSSMLSKDKKSILKRLKEGTIDLIIGTHALIEDDVEFKDLSFVVIDEQHKFGVNQRALLSSKTVNPDVLIMTATPIPRTLCLTLYGDVDVSVIDELPPGRGEIKTFLFPSAKSQDVYRKVREWVNKGTQAYIIYPLVEESDKLELRAATEMFEHLQHHEFKGLRMALVHGQMDRRESDVSMQAFKRGELDILVATTILEVGIDVANANVMVIEHAERFGLSQLHQLRGRIGRGKHNAVCILIGDPTTDEGKARLDALVKTTDGFKIAEYDLEIRGPGHYFGRYQHGANELRMANPMAQMALLDKARQEAIDLVNADTALSKPQSRVIQGVIKKRYPQYLELILAG